MKILKKIIRFFVFLEFMDYIYNFISLRFSRVNYKSTLSIRGRLKIINKGKIIIGRNVTINSGINKNIIGGSTRTNIIVRNKAFFAIGNNIGLSNSTFFCTKSIVIEDDVLIGGDCRFFDTDFHAVDYISRMNPYKHGIPDDKIKSASILIKKGAWIGGSCIILKGVTVGVKSVIGAGSLVSKDVPDNEIWAGNPIKFIRKLSVE
jgi:acetyltransferase-like isoleucine patch superfamily enzyme